MALNLDAVDIKLLSLLQHNNRVTNSELSQQLGLSSSACYRRTQLLETNGVITGYHAAISLEHVALNMQAFVRVFLVKSSRKVLTHFADEVAGWPEVIACYSVTGDCDYLAHVVTRDIPSFTHFMMHRLLVSPSVATANTSLVLEVVKRKATLPLELIQPDS